MSSIWYPFQFLAITYGLPFNSEPLRMVSLSILVVTYGGPYKCGVVNWHRTDTKNEKAAGSPAAFRE